MRKLSNEREIYRVKYDDLGQAEQALVSSARDALQHAYAPYSHFRVGAAVQLSNGTICQGSNQENASYPLCMCAERTAMFHAICRFPDQTFDALAIICQHADRSLSQIGMPCGACRQVILEYETRFGQNIKLVMSNTEMTEVVIFPSVKQLLPFSFDGSML